MSLPELSNIEGNSQIIVERIERESVDICEFLCNEFAHGSVIGNHVFQFTYRSFYRLDNAGLTSDFKTKYFSLMEESRGRSEIDLPGLAMELHTVPNTKGQESLQFSFVTKLANTVNPLYPIYDAEVAKVFEFRAPYSDRRLEDRLKMYMSFYGRLRSMYTDIIDGNLLGKPRRLFREMYAAPPERIPETKVLDFIFWSAGKLGIKTGQT